MGLHSMIRICNLGSVVLSSGLCVKDLGTNLGVARKRPSICSTFPRARKCDAIKP